MNCRLSAVSTGKNFVQIYGGTPGKSGTITSSPTSAIVGAQGFATKFNSSNFADKVSFANQPVNDDQVGTFGLIFTLTALNSGSVKYICSTDSNSNLNGWRLYKSTTQTLTVLTNAATSSTSTFVMALNTPYFIGVSIGPTNTYYAFTNLQTGQLVLESQSTAKVPAGAPNGTYAIGNTGETPIGVDAWISHFMFSGIHISQQRLQQWALDPWSFWYPRRAFNVVAAAVAATGWGPLLSGRRSRLIAA